MTPRPRTPSIVDFSVKVTGVSVAVVPEAASSMCEPLPEEPPDAPEVLSVGAWPPDASSETCLSP